MASATVRADDGLPLTVPDLLHVRAQSHDDRRFVVCDDDVLTYHDAEVRSRELAKALIAVGIGKGSRVGILFPSGSMFATAWLASNRIGAVAVPLSTFMPPGELADILDRADVNVLLAAPGYRSHDYVETVSTALPEFDPASDGLVWSPRAPALRHVVFDARRDDLAAEHRLDALLERSALVDDDVLTAMERDVHASDPMVIVHTSGSTSAPKGVTQLHGPLVRHQDNLNEMRGYTDDEVLFAQSPWFWIGGFAYGLLATFVAGARLVCSNAVAASDVLDLLERERPTMTNGFAASVQHLADDPTFAARDLSSMRRGNLYPIMPASRRPADPELRHQMLGMTEAGSVCTSSRDEADLAERYRGSFGKPVAGFEAEIRHPDTGEPCATGQVGELRLRGPFLMEGYEGSERHEVFEPDQWFCTGDLFHADDEGFVYYHGRSGDMIKTAGANVSPREVEGAIAEHAGLRALVVGIDDEQRGQVVAAAVVSDDDVDVDSLRTTLRSYLSAYKVPRQFLVIRDADVPVKSSGKLDAHALKGKFRAG